MSDKPFEMEFARFRLNPQTGTLEAARDALAQTPTAVTNGVVRVTATGVDQFGRSTTAFGDGREDTDQTRPTDFARPAASARRANGRRGVGRPMPTRGIGRRPGPRTPGTPAPGRWSPPWSSLPGMKTPGAPTSSAAGAGVSAGSSLPRAQAGKAALTAALRPTQLAAEVAPLPTPTTVAEGTTGAVADNIGVQGGSRSAAVALVGAATQQLQRATLALVASLAGTSTMVLLGVAGVILAVIALLASFIPSIDLQQRQTTADMPMMLTGAIAPGTPGVPADLIPIYNAAGTTCPEMPATVLAAQGHQESGFNPRALSPVGAQGIAQFMPGTWAAWGKDGNGDGRADVWDPADAIPAQARFMCALVQQMTQAKKDGKVIGDVQSLALAAYNAGPAAVLTYHGIPPYAETTAYSPAILAYAAKLGATTGSSATGDYAAVIKVLESKIGTPYAFGGGTVNGPTLGWYGGKVGWDCSSFMQMGFYQATGGRVMLPRTSSGQAAAYLAHSVPRTSLQPGDLVFWSGDGTVGGIHHVAMFVGNGQMIEEPHTGSFARKVPLRQDFSHAVRVPLGGTK